MPSVEVINRVRHNDRSYGPGDVIANLTDKQARQLVDANEAKYVDGEKPASEGAPVDAKPSTVKDNLLSGTGSKPSKTVAEKAQEREAKKAAEAKEKADQEAAKANELPTSFSTPEASFSISAGEGDESKTYYRGDAEITEDEYRAAYDKSVEDAGKDDSTGKDPEANFDFKFDHEGATFGRMKTAAGQTMYRKLTKDENGKVVKNGVVAKVEFLQAQGAAGVKDPAESEG